MPWQQPVPASAEWAMPSRSGCQPKACWPLPHREHHGRRAASRRSHRRLASSNADHDACVLRAPIGCRQPQRVAGASATGFAWSLGDGDRSRSAARPARGSRPASGGLASPPPQIRSRGAHAGSPGCAGQCRCPPSSAPSGRMVRWRMTWAGAPRLASHRAPNWYSKSPGAQKSA